MAGNDWIKRVRGDAKNESDHDPCMSPQESWARILQGLKDGM